MPIETIPNRDGHSYYYLRELRGRELIIIDLSLIDVTQFRDADGGFKPMRRAVFSTHDGLDPCDGVLVLTGYLLAQAEDWEDNPRSPDYLVAGLLVKRRPFPTAEHERWELIEKQPANV